MYVISTHVYTVHWMNEEPEKWQKVGTIRVVCYSLNVVNALDGNALKQESNIHVIVCVIVCVWAKRFFFTFEHLKQVWLETFTTKQKGAHCQTFWSFIHNASISRLVSAQLFVCSVRKNSTDDDDDFYNWESKKIYNSSGTEKKRDSIKTKLSRIVQTVTIH